MPDQTVIDRPAALVPDLYSEVSAQLAKMEEENKTLAFDYRDPKGAAQAKSHIHQLKGLNGATDRRHKELKAGILEEGRRIDGAKNQIKSRIAAMIAVHQEPLDQIKAEEEARVAAIEEAMGCITKPMTDLMTAEPTAQDIAAAIEKIESLVIDDAVYQERYEEAVKLRDETLAEARIDHQKMVKYEADQAELERLRRQQAEQERKDRKAAIARQAREEAQQEAEAKAQQERELAAKREAQAKADTEAAELRAQEAERKAEQAKADALAEQERLAKAERDAESQRAADEKHVAKVKLDAAIAVCHEYRRISRDQAEGIIELIAGGKIPNVTINF